MPSSCSVPSGLGLGEGQTMQGALVSWLLFSAAFFRFPTFGKLIIAKTARIPSQPWISVLVLPRE